jgi:hypothetical protein
LEASRWLIEQMLRAEATDRAARSVSNQMRPASTSSFTGRPERARPSSPHNSSPRPVSRATPLRQRTKMASWLHAPSDCRACSSRSCSHPRDAAWSCSTRPKTSSVTNTGVRSRR